MQKIPYDIWSQYDAFLKAGYSGAFMDGILEKKYPKAAKEFIRQWFFPQQSLTPVPAKNEQRRYHLHESHVQEALKKAVGRARLTKRVTAHTFSATVLPRTSCRQTMIFARYRNC